MWRVEHHGPSLAALPPELRDADLHAWTTDYLVTVVIAVPQEGLGQEPRNSSVVTAYQPLQSSAVTTGSFY
ncbi:hypothetical protein CLM62_10530 [Streptomyces sp. SA15]|nr:hypothetical protein CLM62_10530 [Streptomyces sp. SA15]